MTSNKTRIAAGICLAVALILVSRVNAQSLVLSNNRVCTEQYFTGSGTNINLDIPPLELRGTQRESQIIYAIVTFPNADGGTNAVSLTLIPSRGTTWSAPLTSYSGNASSIPLYPINYLPIFAGSKFHLDWTNPGGVVWQLVIYIQVVNEL